MQNEEPVLSVSNLQVSYDSDLIINDLSFTVAERDILIFLGPNGAGKTTLLRALQNLLPYQGTISWNARKISYLPPHGFLHIKFMLQGHLLFKENTPLLYFIRKSLLLNLDFFNHLLFQRSDFTE
jgi:ABC-type cobalamin/Fe3+-siderophores transport system ATPase subunit